MEDTAHTHAERADGADGGAGRAGGPLAYWGEAEDRTHPPSPAPLASLSSAPLRTHTARALQIAHPFLPPPPPLSQVVPDAFRVTRLKVGRRYCRLGRLSSELGWNMSSIVERLEAKRKAEGAVYADAKKAELAKAKAKAAAIPGDAILAKFGY